MLLVIVLCTLNINGLGLMLFGVPQIASPLLFAASAYIIARRSFPSPSAPAVSLIMALLSYMVIGGGSYDSRISVISPISLILTYSCSLLIIVAVATECQASARLGRRDEILRFLKLCFLGAAASVW